MFSNMFGTRNKRRLKRYKTKRLNDTSDVNFKGLRGGFHDPNFSNVSNYGNFNNYKSLNFDNSDGLNLNGGRFGNLDFKDLHSSVVWNKDKEVVKSGLRFKKPSYVNAELENILRPEKVGEVENVERRVFVKNNSSGGGSPGAVTTEEEKAELKRSNTRKRQAVRFNGDVIHAHVFASLLFGSRPSLDRFELQDSLKKLGFSKTESNFLSEILVFQVGNRSTTEIKFENVVQFLSFTLFSQKNMSVLDFGFNLIDQNESKSVSQEELSNFFLLFWNRKLENILDTPEAFSTVKEYMSKSYVTESFDFYLMAKIILQKPFLNEGELKEVIDSFIKVNSPKELNLPEDMRQRLLVFVSENGVGVKQNIKSSVLKDAFEEVASLLQQKVDSFVKEEQNVSKCVAKFWNFAELESKEEMSEEKFRQVFGKMAGVLGFFTDLKEIMHKAWAIAEKNINESQESNNKA